MLWLCSGTIEYIRGAACNLWAQGVDGLYLSSWYDWPRKANYYEKLREVPFPTIMAQKDKIVFVPTDEDRFASTGKRNVGRPSPKDTLERYRWEPSLVQLPVALAVGGPLKCNFLLSDDLPRWAAVDRVHEVLLRVRVTGLNEADVVELALNGEVLEQTHSAGHRKINEMYKMTARQFRVMGYWLLWRLPLDGGPLVQGRNELRVCLLSRDPELSVEHHTLELRDVELHTKYLQGAAFHRGDDYGVDPDLVPLPSLVHSRL